MDAISVVKRFGKAVLRKGKVIIFIKQKKDINKSTQKISASVDASDVKKSRLPKVAGKLTDINWVLERFTY